MMFQKILQWLGFQLCDQTGNKGKFRPYGVDQEVKDENKNWDPNLTPEQNYILKQEGTEAPGSSPLNNEKEMEVILRRMWHQTF